MGKIDKFDKSITIINLKIDIIDYSQASLHQHCIDFRYNLLTCIEFYRLLSIKLIVFYRLNTPGT